jgi:hypothetical protein
MGDFVFNIAKGRVTELVNRVNLNDPANSVVIVAVWNAGAATDATLKDYTTHAAVEADANAAEVTNTGYARKVLNDTSGMTVTTKRGQRSRPDRLGQTYLRPMTTIPQPVPTRTLSR